MTVQIREIGATSAIRGAAPLASSMTILARRPHIAAANDNPRPRLKPFMVALAAVALIAAGLGLFH